MMLSDAEAELTGIVQRQIDSGATSVTVLGNRRRVEREAWARSRFALDRLDAAIVARLCGREVDDYL